MSPYTVTAANLLVATPPELGTAGFGETEMEGILVPNAVMQEIKRKKLNPFIEVEVLAIGPDCKSIFPGDFVVVNQNHLAPKDFPQLKGVDVIPESNVLAVIHGASRKKLNELAAAFMGMA